MGVTVIDPELQTAALADYPRMIAWLRRFPYRSACGRALLRGRDQPLVLP